MGMERFKSKQPSNHSDTNSGVERWAMSSFNVDGRTLSPSTPALLKRKDFLHLDEEAKYHAHRTYYYRKGTDVDDVIDTCTKQLLSRPDDVKALFLRGSTYIKKQMYAEAVGDLTNAIGINAYHTEAFFQRGVAFAKLNEHEKAIVDLTVVLDADPDHGRPQGGF